MGPYTRLISQVIISRYKVLRSLVCSILTFRCGCRTVSFPEPSCLMGQISTRKCDGLVEGFLVFWAPCPKGKGAPCGSYFVFTRTVLFGALLLCISYCVSLCGAVSGFFRYFTWAFYQFSSLLVKITTSAGWL